MGQVRWKIDLMWRYEAWQLPLGDRRRNHIVYLIFYDSLENIFTSTHCGLNSKKTAKLPQTKARAQKLESGSYVFELADFKFGIKILKKQNGRPDSCFSKMHTIFVGIGKFMVLNSLITNFELKFWINKMVYRKDSFTLLTSNFHYQKLIFVFWKLLIQNLK